MARSCGSFMHDLDKLSEEDRALATAWVNGLRDHLLHECLCNFQEVLNQYAKTLPVDDANKFAGAVRECLVSMLMNTAAQISTLNNDTTPFFIALAAAQKMQAEDEECIRAQLGAVKSVVSLVEEISIKQRAEAHSPGN